MEDLSLYSFSNGNHYSTRMNENENEMFDEDEVDENEQVPGNYVVEDEIIQQRPIPPVQNERGGRRKGVPRRLQLSPEVNKAPTQRLIPMSLTKPAPASVHHHEQPILTSDQEDENEIDEIYQQNQNEQNYLQLDFATNEFIDNNNNTSQQIDEYDDILEIVDDILADMVTIIVRDIKQQRRKHQPQIQTKQQTNGSIKLTNGKHLTNGNHESKTLKFATKTSESSTIFNDLTKSLPSNSPQTFSKHKLSPTSSPNIKRQKTVENCSPSLTASLSLQQQQQQQQFLWEMTQQLMMSAAANESDSLAAVNSSLLKQQLLGLTQGDLSTKPKNRPSKVRAESPVASNSPNLNVPPTSTSPFERANFAPRRRGRPPKYVTDRALAGISSLDLDPSALTASYDQLLSAIENGMNPTASSAAFQSALASMLGQQAGLALPTAPVARNGTTASAAKNGAGQTRHSLPTASKLNSASSAIGGLDIPLMATKKRGPGRPPKSQTLFDSHQILQATQRLNSSSSNHFPPTMVPSAANAFNFNAAFADLLQQQQQH